MSLRRLWAVMLKEVRQLRRDRMTLGMILGIPVLQLSRSSAVARSLAELVELVAARRIPESKGLFDRIFGRNDGG